jgi:hypothetical protein
MPLFLCYRNAWGEKSQKTDMLDRDCGGSTSRLMSAGGFLAVDAGWLRRFDRCLSWALLESTRWTEWVHENTVIRP